PLGSARSWGATIWGTAGRSSSAVSMVAAMWGRLGVAGRIGLQAPAADGGGRVGLLDLLALGRQPCLELRGRQGVDLSAHVRVVAAAQLGALALEDRARELRGDL